MELTSNRDGVGTILEEHLCANAVSIAEAKYFPDMCPRAIYSQDQLIGFFMFRRSIELPDEVEICRFMLDHKFSGKGLGRLSFKEILDYFRRANVKTVLLMLEEHNIVAKNLYMSFGFQFTGNIEKEEHFYRLAI
ncbi:GNAT family N-acetyltransferase [Diaphorobacter sp. HDW4A]|uniref:GNAT family N-acetyltransferase n=1 Tax=Diaphorobacter sp. HDW4A TaxID=2714924 RepID=UPI0014087322|nr:GNAT family N-acetyltransferase [Diaphorobacter sp. HDW4A]QIL79946.1 GNAT family N-acetyltransferase [Diaphorobacter sp. HDW4A]